MVRPVNILTGPHSGWPAAAQRRAGLLWTYDFIADRTLDGGTLKWLALVDEYTRECMALHVKDSITGADVRPSGNNPRRRYSLWLLAPWYILKTHVALPSTCPTAIKRSPLSRYVQSWR